MFVNDLQLDNTITTASYNTVYSYVFCPLCGATTVPFTQLQWPCDMDFLPLKRVHLSFPGREAATRWSRSTTAMDCMVLLFSLKVYLALVIY